MEQKIIFIDVDGTLVGNDGVLSKSTLWACEQLKKRGHKLYLCTGRSKAELHDNIMAVGLTALSVPVAAIWKTRGRY